MTESNIKTQVLDPLLDQEFDMGRFYSFLNQLFPDFKVSEQKIHLRKEYKDYVESAQYCGYYRGNSNNPSHFIAVYVIKLKKTNSLNRSRTMQRNLISRYLSDKNRVAALAVFYDDSSEWRLSFVKREQQLTRDQNNNITTQTILSSAKRHSFLVGSERNYTCKSRFLELMEQNITPSLEDIEEIFNVETVTDEFFEKYKELYLKIKKNLDKTLKESKKTDKKIYNDFTENNIKTSDFAKKLMGQIVFVYFLQKKGWLGVKQEQKWGEGSKDFFKELFYKKYYDWETVEESNNFFNNCLEPLFYKGFSFPDYDDHINEFGFKVPFLNGGLFSPIINYDWKNTVIEIDNSIFEDIIKVFDDFNFTVREDNPLEKEVAVDPEMLGKVFEKLLDDLERGSKGAFYTPREIVHYMCKQSLISYLNLNSNVTNEDIRDFIDNSDLYIEKILRYPEDLKLRNNRRIKLPESIYNNISDLDKLLANVKVADPAVGSGAFPVGMMNEIVNARYILQLLKGNVFSDIYKLKKDTIKNSLYCVDIDYSATDITKLRFWLSLIVDKDVIEPLPNLGNNVMCGNSLVDSIDGIKLFNSSTLVFDKEDKNQTTLDQNTSYYKLKRINELKEFYFDEKNNKDKINEKNELEKLKWEFIEESYSSNGGDCETIDQYKNIDFKPFFIWELEFSEVFSDDNPGFDIIIGNPPYVSTKGIPNKDMKIYKEIYGIRDDLYNYFFLKSFDLLKNNGTLSFITSDTYLTLKSKLNLRKLFLKNRILELNKLKNVFTDAKVSPAILIIKKELMNDDYTFKYINSSNSFIEPDEYTINSKIYLDCYNHSLFLPTDFNKQIFSKFNDKTKSILVDWLPKIEDSKKINKHRTELEEYRSTIKDNDFTVIGLITEGGVGLQTSNNGKFIAALDGTNYAERIRETRHEHLYKAISKADIVEVDSFNSKKEAKEFLNNLTESEITELFMDLKEKYGRDILGSGYIFKIISENEIADIESLTDSEKENGIKNGNTYVLYDKGDREGNRWYSESPYYINWSEENVSFFKENSGKGNGLPVVRNPQFYFKEGFCWSDVHTTYIKSRLKSKGVYDVKSMSLFSVYEKIPDWFIVCILNSKFIANYVDNFVNNTVSFQMNDARIIPIIVPNEEQLIDFKEIFEKMYNIKLRVFGKEISKKEATEKLNEQQEILDKKVYELYGLEID